MDKKKEPDKVTVQQTIQQSEKVLQKEPLYNRSELIKAAPFSFGVKPEVVAGALKFTGKDSMTKAEAEKAIKNFLKRRVN